MLKPGKWVLADIMLCQRTVCEPCRCLCMDMHNGYSAQASIVMAGPRHGVQAWAAQRGPTSTWCSTPRSWAWPRSTA